MTEYDEKMMVDGTRRLFEATRKNLLAAAEGVRMTIFGRGEELDLTPKEATKVKEAATRLAAANELYQLTRTVINGAYVATDMYNPDTIRLLLLMVYDVIEECSNENWFTNIVTNAWRDINAIAPYHSLQDDEKDPKLYVEKLLTAAAPICSMHIIPQVQTYTDRAGITYQKSGISRGVRVNGEICTVTVDFDDVI